jgi:hypothetical protein
MSSRRQEAGLWLRKDSCSGDDAAAAAGVGKELKEALLAGGQ